MQTTDTPLCIILYFCRKQKNMKIIDNVKALCTARGITLTDVAERIGIVRNTLYRQLKGDGVQLSTLQRVADAIGCDIADFFTDASQRQPSQTASHQAHDTTRTPASASTSTSLTCPHCGTVINVHITAEQQPDSHESRA